MNKILNLILIFVVGCFVYFNFPVNKCEKVLTFSIENIDSRFGLSKQEAITYLKNSAELWNKGLQKNVLEYSDDGKIKVSFVYDERQRKTIQNNILKEEANKHTQNLSQKISELQVQKENFLELKNQFETELKTFDKDLESYNQEVASINKKGGATETEMQNLETEKKHLLTKQKSLESRQAQLNSYLKSINSDVSEYNIGVRQFNSIAQKINQNSLGEFEEGYFSGNKIVLYEYEDVTTLKRLIAHELGHALGLDHTDATESIMYYINKGNRFVLTKEDIAEYNRVCKK